MHKLLKLLKIKERDSALRMIAGIVFLGLGSWLYPQLSTTHFVITLAVIGVALSLLCWSNLKMQRTLRGELTAITQAMATLLTNGETGQASADHDTQSLARHVQQQLQTLGDRQQQLNHTANDLSEQIHNTQHATTQVSSELTLQHEETQTVFSSLETLNSLLDSALASANEAVAVSKKSETEGASGKLVMTEAMSGIMALGESVNETGSMVETLGKDSEAIGGIVNVIKSVAEQTNLLALNAAIEAARAGEQGRGFAVVADEVRSLANKTQESAQEIEDLIQQLLRNVESANASIHSSMKLAEKSDELVEGVVISYSEIVGYMSEVETLAMGIKDTTQQGQQVTNDATQQLEHMEAVLEHSRGQLTQLEQASSELTALSDVLHRR